MSRFNTVFFRSPPLSRLLGAVCAFLLATALVSCSTQYMELGHKDNLTMDKIATLKKGSTTKPEVESVFGEPTDMILTANGEKYFYKDFNLRSVYMEFDKNGLLVDFDHYK